jgi:membrane protein YqaA with SNARE-associated domain
MVFPMLDSLAASLIEWFELPSNGLSTVFFISLLSATLLPIGSEPAVFGYAKLNPEQFWVVIAVATVGNTIGGAIDYWLGRGAKRAVARERETRYLKWFEQLGPKVLFFSFLPAVGDPLCAFAGWLRLPFWPCVGWMALGKAIRYTVMTALLLWVPDGWWAKLLAPFSGA